MNEQYKYLLDESKLPKAWYNILADMPVPLPPMLNPRTKEPLTAESGALFAKRLMAQERSTERWIEIPEPVRESYKLWRPTPLLRARRLEIALDTPAHIYYKYEGGSPVGSHKPNSAVPQAFYNKQEGVKALTTQTIYGQWGAALAMACNFFDLDVEVYMVKGHYNEIPARRALMQSYGAQIFASPTNRTRFGQQVLAKAPDSPGSAGIAASEAMEAAFRSRGSKKYSLGFQLNHILLHQSVMGLESLEQFEMADEYPDMVIACTSSGTNFGGFAYPFLHHNLTKGKETRLIAVESTACPTLTRGKYAFDYCDKAGMSPIVKMHTLGNGFTPPANHAGSLVYHGMSPTVSALVAAGYIEAPAVPQLDAFEAGILFARAQGIVPSPEPAHAIRIAIDEALRCKATGEQKVIAFNLSGHSNFDMSPYTAYFQGKLENYYHSEDALQKAMTGLPQV